MPGREPEPWGAGADVNAATKEGRATALHRAAHMGHLAVVKQL